jgi:hypothetical protein
MAIEENKQTTIDNHFFVPLGVIDIRQKDAADYAYIYNPSDTASDSNAPVLGTPTSTIPMPPSSFSIIEQRVRISPDGTTVVDVTLQFPDIPGVDHIDVRVTKTT